MSTLLICMPRDVLVKAIQHVYKAASTNIRLPVMSGIYIYAESDGVVFSGSNTSLTVQYKVCISVSHVRVLNKGSIVCPAQYLFEICRKLSDEIVTLEVNGQQMLSITSGNTQVRLSGMPHIDHSFPSLLDHQQTKNSIKLSCNLLVSMIKQVAGAASTSDTKPIFMGVSLEIQGNQLTMIATDGVVRMARRSISVENKAGRAVSAVIPRVNLMEISKILENDDFSYVSIELNHHEISFITQNLLVKSALIEGLYPSTQSLVPSSLVSEVVLNIKSLRQLLDRVSVLANHHLVTLHVSECKLNLISNTAEIGDVSDVLHLEDQLGESFSITINGKYLLSTLRCIDEDHIKVRFTGTRSPLVLLPVLEDSAWLFLITPVMTR